MPRNYYHDWDPNEIRDTPNKVQSRLVWSLQGTPIDLLPPELLTRIFRYVQTFKHTYKRCSAWLLLIIICRRWRDIIFSSSQLWSTIHKRSPYQIQRSLELAKSMPLSVDLGDANFQKARVFKKLVPRFRRFKVHWEGGWQALSNLLSSAPVMETLSLKFVGGGSGSADDFFGDVKPPLRHLSIHGFNPGSLVFPDLNILEVCKPASQFEVPSFLSILRHLPRLVSLRASSMLSLTDPYNPWPKPDYIPAPHDTPVVAWPNLEFISLFGSCFPQDLDFLSHLSFPSTAILLFSTGYPHHDASEYTGITDILKVRAQVCGNGEFSPTSIELLSDTARLKLNFLNGDRVLCALKFNYEDEYLQSGCLGHHLKDEPDVHEMFGHLQYPTVTKFSTSCHVAPAIWRLISSNFPMVQEILAKEDPMAYDNAVATILEVIIEDWKNKPSSESPERVPIFPRLRVLSLDNVTFDDTCIQNLVDVLLSRAKCQPSSRLEELNIHECGGIDEAFVNELKQNVEGLRVDFVERDKYYNSEFAFEEAWSSAGERHENDEGEIRIRDIQRNYKEAGWYEVDSYMVDPI